MDFFELGYPGLFVVCFLSATILPLASEAFLLGMLFLGFDPWWSVILATTGNCFGSTTNYLLGMLGDTKWITRMGASMERIHQFEVKVRKYGHWMALLTWVPVIGDPLMLALGFFRVEWKMVLPLMVFGKLLRYLVIVSPWLF
jgi:membrane protein YqaA with SNARE-associated domain